ncbi:hypothetical protein ACFYSF_47715 [Streptomyces canus]|uniref:hypothetical protein n=1 Tax=Streptomyces canus TaxID=58343 RepID=UPI0036972B2F
MGRIAEVAESFRHRVPTTRLRWFTGRFITARDLTDEQDYHVARHRMHNRLLHGWGTVCGLEVRPHERAECGNEWVRVEPGIAIDCMGREIVLPHREAGHWPIDPERTQAEDALAILCIRYGECLAEPLPAIVADCSSATRTEPGRVVEQWEFELHPVTADVDDEWTRLLRQGPGTAPGAPKDCSDGCGRQPCRGGCIEPVREFGECVPIALLSRGRGEAIRIDVDRNGIRRDVRRSLPPPVAYLTHIVATSWEHGGELGIDELIDAGGELRVRFDRDLAPADGLRTGVNQFTFLVEIEDSTGSRERLDFDAANTPRVQDGCVAVFTVDPDALRRSGRHGGLPKLVGDTVFVTVLGDLIKDCHGIPVDADFLGTFPTGDGIKGGVLRSWFSVTERGAGT